MRIICLTCPVAASVTLDWNAEVLGFFHESRLEKIGINLEKVGTVTVTLELGLLGGLERSRKTMR